MQQIYCGGYHTGQRLRHVPGALAASESKRTTDRFLIGSGVNIYADGFADGWRDLKPRYELLPKEDWQ